VLPPLPWRPILRTSALATAGLALLLVLGVVLAGRGGVVTLVAAGDEGPSAEVLRRDFPGTELPPGLGHDGQQFYAIARALPHLSEAVPALDRPAYRLQRPLLPVLAWLVHPGASGPALAIALAAVGLAAVALGCVATGAVATTLGGSPHLAAAFAALPGTWAALRLGVADNLALALAAAALALSLRGRRGWAVAAAVAAVLAKESILLVLLPLALWPRPRRHVALVAVPAGVAAALALALRWWLPPSGAQVTELVLPFSGLATVVPAWLRGEDAAAGLLLAGACLAGVAALRTRGRSGDLRLVAALHVAFVVSLSPDVVGLSFNVARATAPLLWAAVLVLATGARVTAPDAAGAPAGVREPGAPTPASRTSTIG